MKRASAKVISYVHLASITLILCAIIGTYYSYDYARLAVMPWIPWFGNLVLFEFQNHINGTLLFIPLIYAAFAFWWKGALIVWLVSIAALSLHLVRYTANINAAMANFFYLLIPPLIIAVIVMQLSWRDREREAMAEREKERQVYIAQIFKAQEDERQRIARELHDDTMQTLVVIAHDAQVLLKNNGFMSTEERSSKIEAIKDSAVQLSEDLRKLILDLRPSILDNLGLLPALRWLVTRLEKESKIKAQIEVQGSTYELSPEIQLNIFRFAQEALSNVKRHSEASEAFVHVDFKPGTCKLVVRDNGKGFHIPEEINDFANQGKLGLIGMRERARFVGAAFEIDAKRDKGTTVSLTIERPPA
jgi:signal transduction histidine kinase